MAGVCVVTSAQRAACTHWLQHVLLCPVRMLPYAAHLRYTAALECMGTARGLVWGVCLGQAHSVHTLNPAGAALSRVHAALCRTLSYTTVWVEPGGSFGVCVLGQARIVHTLAPTCAAFFPACMLPYATHLYNCFGVNG